jgi:Domain of unknown function (DUF4386)
VALAGVATAVTLFPILKKGNESLAPGLVAARILESATIFVGVALLLSVVTLRRDGTGTLVTSHALVALYDRIFLLGQSFIPAVCDVLLGFLLYASHLVPRGLALIGIAGGPVLVVGYLAVLFGAIDQHGSLAGLSALLVAGFEFSLGVYSSSRDSILGLSPHSSPRTDAHASAAGHLSRRRYRRENRQMLTRSRTELTSRIRARMRHTTPVSIMNAGSHVPRAARTLSWPPGRTRAPAPVAWHNRPSPTAPTPTSARRAIPNPLDPSRLAMQSSSGAPNGRSVRVDTLSPDRPA